MRVESLLRLYNVPLLNRIACFILKRRGLVIPITVKIGKNVKFPHGAVGTVIHPDTIIGDNVKIYQNVTIGRGDIWQKPSDDFRGFIIDNSAILCAGSKIISSHGIRRVGQNSIVGANAVLTKDCPDNCVCVGIPAKICPIRK